MRNWIKQIFSPQSQSQPQSQPRSDSEPTPRMGELVIGKRFHACYACHPETNWPWWIYRSTEERIMDTAFTREQAERLVAHYDSLTERADSTSEVAQ